MKTLFPVALALAVTMAVAPSAQAADEPVEVLQLDVRFKGHRADLEVAGGPISGKVRFIGDVVADTPVTRWSPSTDHLRLTVGPLVLVEGPGYAGDVRVKTTGRWRLDLRARDALGPRSRLRVRFDALTGVLDLKAARVDVGALRAAGSHAVPVVLEIGEEVFTASLDLDDQRLRRWSYRYQPDYGGGGTGGGGGGGNPPPPPPPSSITWAVVRSGDRSNLVTPRNVVLRDQASLLSFWALHSPAPGSNPGPTPGFPESVPPVVDWSREMLVGVFIGSTPFAGSGVVMDAVAGAGNGLVARYTESRPGPGCPALFVPVSPYVIVKVTRVQGSVKFERTTQVLTCK